MATITQGPKEQVTYLLIALLLPLRDEVGISVIILQKPFVQFLADGFLLVVEVVDISGACGKVCVSL